MATHHFVSQQPWVPFILSAKTKQAHAKKKAPKPISFICSLLPVEPEYWIKQTLYPKTIGPEVQVTPSYTERDLERTLEERNEFHREPKVKGKFGFQAGM